MTNPEPLRCPLRRQTIRFFEYHLPHCDACKHEAAGLNIPKAKGKAEKLAFSAVR